MIKLLKCNCKICRAGGVGVLEMVPTEGEPEMESVAPGGGGGQRPVKPISRLDGGQRSPHLTVFSGCIRWGLL